MAGLRMRRRAWLAAAACASLSATPAVRAALPPPRTRFKVGFVVDLVPFVIEQSRGIFPDLMREALGRLGYALDPFEFPSRRFDFDPLGQFSNLDLFVGTPATHREDNFYAPIYEFSNVAVSLTSAHLKVQSVDDLRGKDIVAFNNASIHLKEPFTSLYERELKGSTLYHEVENQRAQFNMLLQKRTQLILLDRTMVRYRAAQSGIKGMKGLTLHEIFPLTNTVYVVGRDAELIRRLDETIRAMQQDGSFRKVLAAYE